MDPEGSARNSCNSWPLLLHCDLDLRPQSPCRINPPRFLAECRKRRLNQGSFVLLYFRLSNLFDLYLVSVCLFSSTALFVSISQVNNRLQNDLHYTLLTHSLTHSLWPQTLIDRVDWKQQNTLLSFIWQCQHKIKTMGHHYYICLYILSVLGKGSHLVFWLATGKVNQAWTAAKTTGTLTDRQTFQITLVIFLEARQETNKYETSKGTMDPEGSARKSCNSWPLYARWADQWACFG